MIFLKVAELVEELRSSVYEHMWIHLSKVITTRAQYSIFCRCNIVPKYFKYFLRPQQIFEHCSSSFSQTNNFWNLSLPNFLLPIAFQYFCIEFIACVNSKYCVTNIAPKILNIVLFWWSPKLLKLVIFLTANVICLIRFFLTEYVSYWKSYK